MRLSEAIREGEKFGGNDRRAAFVWDGPDGQCGCALGGAGLVVGLNFRDFREALHGKGKFAEQFPVAATTITEAPSKMDPRYPFPSLPKSLAEVISLLFEMYGWSKGAISEYVEQIERKLGLWDVPAPVVEAVKAETRTEVIEVKPREYNFRD
jgi:hypothetical protein